jgi:putative transposase
MKRWTPGWALSPAERRQVRDTLNSEAYRDLAPNAAYARLLDAGVYLCSRRTMYRVLAEFGEVKERRAHRPPRHYVRPELVATAPKQVYTWDITKLRLAIKGQFLYLYIMIDLFSRYVAGWMIADRETGELAKNFIAETMAKEGITEGQATIHADRGSPMIARPVADLFEELGIIRSLSRPRVPNDNPFSESQIKTIKYRPSFPRSFADREAALVWAKETFTWYNHEHAHSSLALLSPAIVHAGLANQLLAKRQTVLDTAFEQFPERFPKGRPSAGSLPPVVYINNPALEANSASQPPRPVPTTPLLDTSTSPPAIPTSKAQAAPAQPSIAAEALKLPPTADPHPEIQILQ